MQTDGLVDFHLSCKKELDMLTKSFNILLYGYGSKKSILMQMFPSAFYFNCRLQKPRDILMELIDRVARRSRKLHPPASLRSVRELDRLIGQRREKYKLIVANFDFDLMRDFCGLRNFAILGTIESVDVKFSYDDVERFNFIFRDLTTFRPYEDEIVGMQLRLTRTESALNVIRNVPRNSRIVLREILQLQADTVGLDEVFEKTKKRLFLTSRSSLLLMISEFVDHRILRVRDNTEIVVNLPAAERRRLLDGWDTHD